jgi:hypothetical protein
MDTLLVIALLCFMLILGLGLGWFMRRPRVNAAEKLVVQLKPNVERSARSTMQALAAGFEVQFVEVHFSSVQGAIHLPALPTVAELKAA